MKVAIIGTGDIAERYALNAKYFRNFKLVACTNRSLGKGEAFAKRHKLNFQTEAEILENSQIEAIFNLTPPTAHAEITLRAIKAGKHVYSEKPLATNLNDAYKIGKAASKQGLRISCAPDTILGALTQTIRQKIDAGEFGQIHSGIAQFQSSGMEGWHPNPAFFFKSGAGPVLDIGPYHIATLVFLLGSVRSVSAFSKRVRKTRIVGSGELKGTKFPVEIQTTTHAILQFENGAIFSVIASFDVIGDEKYNIHIYGQNGSIKLPDPNWFSGEVSDLKNQTIFSPIPDYPSSIINDNNFANYRGLGMAEMIDAINTGRPHRCSFELAYHVLEVLLQIEESAKKRAVVEIKSRVPKLAVMSTQEQQKLLKQM